MSDTSDVEHRLTFSIEGRRVRYTVDEVTDGKRRRIALFQSQLFGDRPAAITASKLGSEIRVVVVMQDDKTTWRLVDTNIVCSEESAFEKVAAVVSAWADGVNSALEAPVMFVQRSSAYVVAHSNGLSVTVEAQEEDELDFVNLTSYRNDRENFNHGVTRRIYYTPPTSYQKPHKYDSLRNSPPDLLSGPYARTLSPTSPAQGHDE